MKVTRYSGPVVVLGAGLGGDPTAPDGGEDPDCCDIGDAPDRALDGFAYRMPDDLTFSIVQSAFARTATEACTVTLAAAATAGNMLIAWHAVRDDEYPDTPSGFTALAEGVVWASDEATDVYSSAMFYKVAAGGETSILTNLNSPGSSIAFVVEVSGLTAFDTSAESQFQNGATLSVSVTPSGGPTFIIGGFVTRISDTNDQTVTPDGDTTELLDESRGTSNPFSPHSFVGYRTVESPSGAYTVGGTISEASRDWGAQVAAFDIDTPGYTVLAPNVNDDDDATYETITDNTELLRIDLGAPFRISSTRIRIAANTAGARTFTIKGANVADFSDEVTLTTIAFTATGSYTAQDVTGSWAATDEYQYYELTIGTSDTYRIHEWELFEASLTGDIAAVADDLADHLADTVDAHDASAVSIADAGAYYTGTTVEAALQEIGAASGYVTVVEGGGETLSTVAASGATETIDLTDGNVHDVTLSADCTFTFAAVAGGAGRSFTLILRQDGTGGWTTTWPGSVVWPGGVAPTLDETASTVAVLTFFTIDGGSVWYGFSTGGSGGTPATTVEAETTFGISSAVGTDTEYARQDHTHGTPANPVTEAAVQAVGHYEILMASGSADPLLTSDGLDYLWVWVT